MKTKKNTKDKQEAKAYRKELLRRLKELGEDCDCPIVLLGQPPECVEAIIGVTYTTPPRAVYSRTKYLEGLMKANKWTYDEAVEWFEFNTVRALEYMKDGPIIVDTEITEIKHD